MVTPHSATIQWRVPEIAYTPEEYKVLYGTTQANLDFQSGTIAGSQNYSAVNETVSVVLSRLLPETTYYYRVTARNTATSTMSMIGDFVTPASEEGMYSKRLLLNPSGI